MNEQNIYMIVRNDGYIWSWTTNKDFARQCCGKDDMVICLCENDLYLDIDE